MTTFSTFVLALALTVTINEAAHNRMHAAIGLAPEFSHRRDQSVPQNIDIVDPQAGGVPVGIPVDQSAGGAKNFGQVVKAAVQEQVKPPGQVMKAAATQQVVANDRMVDGMFQNQAPVTQRRPIVQQQQECDFNIPSFLLPDMTVTQRDFEQMYLLPALRAHLTARSCRSRALTVYIDWLLYLRLRNYMV